jgi:hypothetical protein
MLVRSLLGLGALLAIFLLIRNLWRRKETPNKIEEAFNRVFDNSDYKATKQNWIDVSRMETAGWSSKLFVNGNNLWGMKKARKRPNTQSSEQWGSPGRDNSAINPTAIVSEVTGQNQWASYRTLDDAVKDIILWMQYTKFPNRPLSLRDHIQEMKNRSYFVGEDVAEYLGKVVAWKNRNVA